jgi:FtsP/CotA-like multicopper oxidase with cupredoxin domain
MYRHSIPTTALRRRPASLWLAVLFTGSLLACGGEDAIQPDIIDPPGPVTIASIGGGSFGLYADYQGIYGRAQVLRNLDGTTTFELHIEGLTPELEYPAHVHALPCDVNSGGGHYKYDPTIVDPDEANEIWPAFTTDVDGIGRVTVNVAYEARMDAQSIVIHDPENGNVKMACADLRVPYQGELTRSGTLAPFAAAEPDDMTIAGSAEMVTNDQGTTFTMTVQGLSPAAQYSSHIHAYPCSVNDAGGHYKLDPTVLDPVADNELWPEITPDAEGNASVQLSSPHSARNDAQAVVIHRVEGGGAPKVACADLKRGESIEFTTVGESNILPAGSDRYPGLAAYGSMNRRLDGSTVVRVSLSGLSPGQEYPVHVHAYTCNTADGGGHYKLDPSIADTVPDNEMWLPATTDETGGAARARLFQHLARPEAQSIVVHDYDDNERLLCLSLD